MIEAVSPLTKVAVAPHDIERSLIKLWHDTVQAMPGGQERGIRAILGNVVLVSDETFSSAVREELLTELCIEHPSRFFVVTAAAGSTAILETGISSRCVAARSGKHVCSEEIYITVGSDRARGLPSLLLSLFVPDVPEHVVLLGDFVAPQHQALIAAIERIPAGVIYDSQAMSPQNVVREIDQRNLRRSWVDLNWLRLERWRVVVADLFDSPVAREWLPEISRLTLAAPRNSQQAMLFAAWFAVALRWRFAEWLQGELHFEREDGERVTIAFETPCLAPHELGGFEIFRASRESMVSARCDAASCVITLQGCRSSARTFCDFSVNRRAFPAEKLEETLVRALQPSQPDLLFPQVRAIAHQIAAELG